MQMQSLHFAIVDKGLGMNEIELIVLEEQLGQLFQIGKQKMLDIRELIGGQVDLFNTLALVENIIW